MSIEVDTTGLTRLEERYIIAHSINPVVEKARLAEEDQGMHVVLGERADGQYPLDERWWQSADLVTIENAAGEIVGVPKKREAPPAQA